MKLVLQGFVTLATMSALSQMSHAGNLIGGRFSKESQDIRLAFRNKCQKIEIVHGKACLGKPTPEQATFKIVETPVIGGCVRSAMIFLNVPVKDLVCAATSIHIIDADGVNSVIAIERDEEETQEQQ